MKFSYLFLMLAFVSADNAMHGDSQTDTGEEAHSGHTRTKANKKVYDRVYIGCGAVMLWLIIDLWVIMSDSKKVVLPYYLEPTDTNKKEDLVRKQKEKELIKEAKKGKLGELKVKEVEPVEPTTSSDKFTKM